MPRTLTLLVAVLVAILTSACGPRTFARGPDDGTTSREGFSAHHEADADAPSETEGDAAPEEEETFVDDESVDFDSDAGPFQEVE